MAKVRRIMLTDVPILKKEAKIEEAARLLSDSRHGCIIILEKGFPVGIITDMDFVRYVVNNNRSQRDNVSSIMSSPVSYMYPDMDLNEALRIVDTKKHKRYPVVENSKFLGLVTENDIVTSISENVRLHRNIQNAVLVIFLLFELFIFFVYRYLYIYTPMGF